MHPTRKRKTALGVLAAAALLAFLLSNMAGAAPIDPLKVTGALLGPAGDWLGIGHASETERQIIFSLRMPRALLAFVVGSALAASGAALQGLFRNPLADPSLIGVSAGGAVGAGAVIVLGTPFLRFLPGILTNYGVMIGAMAGSVAATFIIYRLSQTGGRIHVPTMLLCGIAINAFAGALVGLLVFLADLEALRDLTFWSLGSLARAPREAVFSTFPIILLLLFLLFRHSTALNAFLLGDAEAGHLGIDTHPVQSRVIALAGAVVGLCVALSGTIGFIGLIVPHFTRLLVGPDHRFVLPAAALGGGILLTTADVLARTAFPSTEIPIGILTAFIGAPFFLFLLLSAKRREIA